MKRYHIAAFREDPITKEKWVEIWTRIPGVGIRRLSQLEQKDWLAMEEKLRLYIDSRKDAETFVQKIRPAIDGPDDTPYYFDVQLMITRLA